MFKKQSKPRKNKTNQKLILSRSKLPKQPIKQKLQIKERRISNKHNHQSSTFTLLSNHNNSQYSVVEGDEDNLKKGKSKNMRASVSSLLGKDGAIKDKQKDKEKSKKDANKIKKNSSVNVNSKSRKNISKVSPAKIDKSDKNSKILKQNPKKSKLLNQQQLYQRINLALYKTKTNSEINFSNNSSVRENNVSNSNLYNNYLGKNRNEGKNTNKKTLTIDCSDQYILNQYFSNSRIKNTEKKKQDAAIKIQKVFRGFLTRKMLQEFIEKQEEKLYEMEKRIKSSSSRQSQQFPANLLKKELNQSQQKRNERFFEEQINKVFPKPKSTVPKQQPIAITTTPEIKQKQESTKQLKNRSIPLQIDLELKQSKKQIFSAINHSALQEESSIYPQQHDSISRYLPFTENTNQVQGLDDQSEIYENYDNVRLNQRVGCEEEDQIEKQGQFVEKQEYKYKEISEELFKYTPSSHAPKSKSKIEEPMPTDFSEKRVHEFESDIKDESKSKQLPDTSKNHESITRPPKRSVLQTQLSQNISKGNKKNEHDRKQIFLLKKQQKQKWNKIIQMLSHQIVETKSKNQDNEKFMRMILDFSKKNKEQLQKSASNIMQPSEILNQSSKIQVRQDNLTFLKEQISLELSPSKIMSKQFQIQQNSCQQQPKYETKSQKNQNMPSIMSKKPPNLNVNLYSCHIPKSHNMQNYSLFEKTEQLKNLYKKNFAAYPIEQMVQIRQKALEKRQRQMMNKLNDELSSMALTHEEFIERLSQMQEKFENERTMINQAKMEIFIGYRATHRLMQDSVKDAWYLGFKIPFSQSLKDFKGTNHNNLWVRDVIVDQLKSYSQHHAKSLQSPKDKKKPAIIKQHKKITNLEQSLEDITPYKEKSSEKKRQDLSISIPNEDSSLTIRPSNEVSQQSFLEEISYNEGEVEMQGLEEHPGKDQFIFHDDFSEEQQSSEQRQQEREIKGFRKVDPQKLVKKKVVQDQSFNEGPLLMDPDEQQQIDLKVMRKISVNQRKRPHESYINLEKLRKYEMTPRHNSNLGKIPPLVPKSQIYKVDSGSDDSEDEIIFNEEMDPEIKQITEQQVVNLIWEAVSQFFISFPIKSKLCRNKSKGPTIIDENQRKSFIKYLQLEIPAFNILKPRINQKMMASRLELLKFMRVTFDEESQELEDQFYADGLGSSSDDGFEEIGKFQHILPAQVCISALNKYLNLQQQNITKEMTLDQERSIEKKVFQNFVEKVPKQCLKKIVQRQKQSMHNKFQKKDLRKQIKKVEFHCIFDSLNQILMKRRLRSTGYSGIGLNQLTLVIARQNFKQISTQQQYKQIQKQSFKELNELIGNEKSSSDKLLMENYQKLCENDSQWIYYTDQALSFALEFVYMLEDEIFFQETSLICKFLRRL